MGIHKQPFRFFSDELISDYRKYCVASDCWTDAREKRIKAFDHYCRNNWPEESDLKQEMIDEYCKKSGVAAVQTVRIRAIYVNHFLRFMSKREFSHLQTVEVPKDMESTYIPHAFTEEELHLFFQACEHVVKDRYFKTDPVHARNLKMTIPVIFRLLYSTGMRTIEARLLKTEDVNLETGVISIRKSKGHGQHYVVMHDSMLELMKIYNTSIAKLYPNRQYFFPGKAEKPNPNYWLETYFKRAWYSFSNEKAVPYEFRHNYAIVNINSWIGTGFETYDKLYYLSKSMGHCDVESTKRYYSLTPAIADILDECDTGDDLIPEVKYEESQ